MVVFAIAKKWRRVSFATTNRNTKKTSIWNKIRYAARNREVCHALHIASESGTHGYVSRFSDKNIVAKYRKNQA
jgi:hypothetical protein